MTREGLYTGRRRVHLVDMDEAPNYGLCGAFCLEAHDGNWDEEVVRWATIICRTCKAAYNRRRREAKRG